MKGMYINNVVIVGNLTSNPVVQETDGTKVASFRLAVNRWRKPGQQVDEGIQERTEFIDVETWGSQAENVEATLQRGDRAIVAGQLRFDQWNDDDGNIKTHLKVKAFAVGPSLEFQSLGK
jgi:single-strand DNA-binding protein